jgi:hypothetical protein
MTLIQLITLIVAAIAPTLMALSALIASLKNATAIKEVHLSLNSRLSELIVASKAKGAIEEQNKNAAKENAPKVKLTPAEEFQLSFNASLAALIASSKAAGAQEVKDAATKEAEAAKK